MNIKLKFVFILSLILFTFGFQSLLIYADTSTDDTSQLIKENILTKDGRHLSYTPTHIDSSDGTNKISESVETDEKGEHFKVTKNYFIDSTGKVGSCEYLVDVGNNKHLRVTDIPISKDNSNIIDLLLFFVLPTFYIPGMTRSKFEKLMKDFIIGNQS